MSEIIEGNKTGVVLESATTHEAAAWPSGLPLIEPQGQCERSRLATGSLPVSRAEALCEEWEVFALALECNADTHGAETVRLLVKDLRREMVLSYPRQPEENNAVSQPGGQS